MSTDSLPFKLKPKDLEGVEVINLTCNDVQMRKLLDLYQARNIPQPLWTGEKDGFHVLYLPNLNLGAGCDTKSVIEENLGIKFTEI